MAPVCCRSVLAVASRTTWSGRHPDSSPAFVADREIAGVQESLSGFPSIEGGPLTVMFLQKDTSA